MRKEYVSLRFSRFHKIAFPIAIAFHGDHLAGDRRNSGVRSRNHDQGLGPARSQDFGVVVQEHDAFSFDPL